MFLGVSKRLFWKEISFWIGKLKRRSTSPMLLGIIQSVESLNRKKRRRREEFAVCLSWDHLLPLDISVLVLRPLDSDQNLYHWPPNSQAFRDKLGLTPSTPMVHRPLDFNWITPLFSFWFGLVCFSSSSLLMASLGTFWGFIICELLHIMNHFVSVSF